MRHLPCSNDYCKGRTNAVDMLRRKVPTEERTSQSLPNQDEEFPSGAYEATLENVDSKRRRTSLDLFLWVARSAILLGRRCYMSCLFCMLIFVLTINEGHHLTCRIHGALCTPFREYIVRFPMLPRRRSWDKFAASRLKSQHSCQRFENFLSQHNHENRRLLFLIGESRGGSTYSYDTLNLHPNVEMVGQEALFTFSNTICNNNELLLRNHKNCTFDNWLQALYENSYDRKKESKNLVGTKINIEQIPPEFYEDLASYLSCIRTSAVILHVSRASTIASFFNYQAEVPERLYAKNFDFDSNQLAKGLESQLELDAELAADWVHKRDALSQDLFRILSFGAPQPLRYQRVYFEHLSDPDFGDFYWRSVFAFLGLNSRVSVKQLRQSQKKQKGQLRTYNKTHGDRLCHQRIANWDKVKKALGPESLSSVACEGYA